jgi:hypothetical protein
MVGIAIAIVVAIALFSIFPTIMGSFTCPAITGDTNGNFKQDTGENFTETPAVVAWKQSCNQIQTQTTIVPVLLALAIVIAAIVLVTRMFA